MNNLPSGITRICHLNIRSVHKKVNSFKHFLITNSIGICILSETWLRPSQKLAIPNYNIIRKDRSDRPGGGVMIALHNSISYEQIKSPPSCSEEEIIILKLHRITRDNEDVSLVAWYNPPNRNVRLEALQEFSDPNQRFLIMGDLNAHHEIWHSGKSDASGIAIEKFLEDNEFLLLNDDSPTYEPDNKPYYKSILDLALCSENLSNQVFSFSVSNFEFSDHNPIFVDLFARSTPRFGQFTKQIRRTDWQKFATELDQRVNELTINDIKSTDELDKASSDISKAISDALESSTYSKTISYNPNGRMILPRHIVNIIEEKRFVRRLYRRTQDPRHKTWLNQLDKTIQHEIKQHKQSKWQEFCTELNTHRVSDTVLWRKLEAIESAGIAKPRKTPALKVGNQVLDEPEAVANVFADSLACVFRDPSDPKHDDHFRQLVDNSVPSFFTNNPTRIDPITLYEVADQIKKLKSRGAPGQDTITNLCLKRLTPATIPILATIFNASLTLGHIPAIWKRAIVTMIPKPLKDHSDVANFRPISLLNTLSKLLEHLILGRMQYWIGSNGLLSTYQCGFRKFRQTKDHILRIVQSGLTAFNRNEKLGAIFIDIEKAFDRVWHNGLLFKLNNLGNPNYLG